MIQHRANHWNTIFALLQEMYQRFDIRLIFKSQTKTPICWYLVVRVRRRGRLGWLNNHSQSGRSWPSPVRMWKKGYNLNDCIAQNYWQKWSTNILKTIDLKYSKTAFLWQKSTANHRPMNSKTLVPAKVPASDLFCSNQGKLLFSVWP